MENIFQPNLDISASQDIVCDACNNPYFIEVVLLKKFSKFMTGSDKDQVYPFPVLQCSKCGHVNEEFIPKQKNVTIPTK